MQHISEHDIAKEEVEEVLSDPNSTEDVSDSSGYPITFGTTASGRRLAVVWELASDDPVMVRPITAYEV